MALTKVRGSGLGTLGDGTASDTAIENADTVAKLKAAWDTSTLGTSPYA